MSTLIAPISKMEPIIKIVYETFLLYLISPCLIFFRPNSIRNIATITPSKSRNISTSVDIQFNLHLTIVKIILYKLLRGNCSRLI